MSLSNDEGWISVDEGLPPPNETVLIHFNHESIGGKVQTGWRREGDDWSAYDSGVAHWRHLPEPPESP